MLFKNRLTLWRYVLLCVKIFNYSWKWLAIKWYRFKNIIHIGGWINYIGDNICHLIKRKLIIIILLNQIFINIKYIKTIYYIDSIFNPLDLMPIILETIYIEINCIWTCRLVSYLSMINVSSKYSFFDYLCFKYQQSKIEKKIIWLIIFNSLFNLSQKL